MIRQSTIHQASTRAHRLILTCQAQALTQAHQAILAGQAQVSIQDQAHSNQLKNYNLKTMEKMKLNFAVILFKDIEDEAGINIKHMTCYSEEPSTQDIEALVQELATDESLGMVGDTDYKISVINRKDDEELFALLEIPEEVDPLEDLE